MMGKLKREMTDDRGQMTEGPQLIATGQVSGGVSVTHVPFRSMASVDEICNVAIRRVVRALKSCGNFEAKNRKNKFRHLPLVTEPSDGTRKKGISALKTKILDNDCQGLRDE